MIYLYVYSRVFRPIEYIFTHAFYQGRRRLSMIKLAISKEFKSISSQHIEAIKWLLEATEAVKWLLQSI
jgi:hypothetical protein